MNYSIKVTRESKELLESAAIESLCLFSDELVSLAKKAKLEQPKLVSAVGFPASSRPPHPTKSAAVSSYTTRDQLKPLRPPVVPPTQQSTSRSKPGQTASAPRADTLRRKALDSTTTMMSRADSYRVAPPSAPGQQPPFPNYTVFLLSLVPSIRNKLRKIVVNDKLQAI